MLKILHLQHKIMWNRCEFALYEAVKVIVEYFKLHPLVSSPDIAAELKNHSKATEKTSFSVVHVFSPFPFSPLSLLSKKKPLVYCITNTLIMQLCALFVTKIRSIYMSQGFRQTGL